MSSELFIKGTGFSRYLRLEQRRYILSIELSIFDLQIVNFRFGHKICLLRITDDTALSQYLISNIDNDSHFLYHKAQYRDDIQVVICEQDRD